MSDYMLLSRLVLLRLLVVLACYFLVILITDFNSNYYPYSQLAIKRYVYITTRIKRLDLYFGYSAALYLVLQYAPPLARFPR
jgi:hypothetical protein